MKTHRVFAIGFGLLLLVGSGAAHAIDTDGDGVLDQADNCLDVANPDQRDTNLDGYGNLCDPDVAGLAIVNAEDFSAFVGVWTTLVPPTSGDFDLDDDGVVGMPDLIPMPSRLGSPAGPSGLNCAGTIPCSAPIIPGPALPALLLGALLLLLTGRRATLRAASVVALPILVLGAAPAEAQVQIDLVWTATTGSGTPGGTSITAAPGDTLTAQIFLDENGEDVCCYAYSVRFDTDLGNELDLVSVIEHIPPLAYTTVSTGVEATQESSGSQNGEVTTFAALDFIQIGGAPAIHLVGEVVFDVTANVATDGADVVSGAFNAGVDAVGSRADGSGDHFENVTPSVVFGTLSVDVP